MHNSPLTCTQKNHIGNSAHPLAGVRRGEGPAHSVNFTVHARLPKLYRFSNLSTGRRVSDAFDRHPPDRRIAAKMTEGFGGGGDVEARDPHLLEERLHERAERRHRAGARPGLAAYFTIKLPVELTTTNLLAPTYCNVIPSYCRPLIEPATPAVVLSRGTGAEV